MFSELAGSSNQDDPNPNSNILPDIVIKHILTNISDQLNLVYTLLNCREVCVKWNQIIENTAELMFKIPFVIWHPKPFFDLPIVQRQKVRSIVIKNPLSLEYLPRFTDLFNVLESVKFDFENSTTKGILYQNSYKLQKFT